MPVLAWTGAWHGLEPGMDWSQAWPAKTWLGMARHGHIGHALWPVAYRKAWVQSLVLTAATATAAGAAWLDGTNAGNSLNRIVHALVFVIGKPHITTVLFN